MRRLSALGALLGLLCFASTAGAQTATGQITGTVTDSTGAVVPGASVTISSPLTGLTRTTTTNDTGDYVFTLLPVGTYNVRAELTGFRPAQREQLKLNVDQVVRINVELEVGELTDAVIVEAATVMIETESASISETITEKQITDLPLNGRNYLQLLFLGAGAVETTGEQGGMRQGVGNAISIMGARPTSNNFMIDGTSNVDTAIGTPAAILSIDAIEEFKEQTATYSAEYGFSANQVNLVSKSGTNEFHGSLFGFMRDEALDARNYFDAPGSDKPPLDEKRFGAVIHGPLVKDKTFFLLNYEGARVTNENTRFFTVPTTDQLAGQFDTQIIDPQTGLPFPGNTVPSSRFSRMGSAAAQSFWPAPNTDVPQGNYTDVAGGELTQDQYTIRVDHDLGNAGRMMARFTRTQFENRTPGLTELGDRFFIQNTNNWQVAHTWPLSSNVLNHFRFGKVDALADQHGSPCDSGVVDSLGLTGVFTSATAVSEQLECPTMALAQGLAAGGGAINAYTASNQPMWDVSNTTTWVTGDHTVKFGVNYRRWSLQRDLATGFTGDLTFDGRFTGNPVADMLLGVYSGAAAFQPGPLSLPDAAGNPREFNFSYLAPYIQDDWRITPKLTLNLGLRYDYRSLPYETNDRMGWRDLSNPQGGLCVADPRLEEAGVLGDQSYYRNCGLRTPDNPDKWKVLAPRVGFAYRPTDSGRTVIRGGYGLFFDSAEGREIDGAADIFPYAVRTNLQQPIGTVNPATTDSLFPSFTQAGVATPAANTFLAVSQSPEPKNPRMHQWSLSVQQQVTDKTTVEMNYVGSHGSNLLMRRNIAQALPYTPDNPGVVARRPFANFGTYIDSDWNGTSDYHAMNVRLQHRTTNLIATAAYTWAKSLDTKSAAAGIGASAFNGWQGLLDNNAPPENDRGLSDFDVDHRLVASFVWNLPIAESSSGVTKAVLGGWQVNGIVTWQRGFPFTARANDIGGVLDTFGTNRADVVPGADPSAGGGSTERWFNTDAFTQPGFGQFGNVGRNTLRAPSHTNFDLALFKNFYVGPQVVVQLRFESFNALNHPQFDAPNAIVGNPNYGVIGGAEDGRINQLGLKLIW
jgi:outer membrane receptor protein involved in Fe transport